MLTYQLATFDACFGTLILQVAEHNDSITGMPLAIQFESLLSANTLKSVEWAGGQLC
jgi:hypothetical protein